MSKFVYVTIKKNGNRGAIRTDLIWSVETFVEDGQNDTRIIWGTDSHVSTCNVTESVDEVIKAIANC